MLKISELGALMSESELLYVVCLAEGGKLLRKYPDGHFGEADKSDLLWAENCFFGEDFHL